MMDDTVQCLDHGFVRLVSCTENPDLAIVRAARVSYDAAWRAGEDEKSDRKLINYLWKNRHTTPFESVNLTFEVKAPIFIFRQWHRHRTWSYNEVSARYTELPEDFYSPTAEVVGSQSTIDKQARKITGVTPEEIKLRTLEIDAYAAACKEQFEKYRFFLAQGWPRELARMVLPLSTYSHMFATVDLNNLFKFLILRDDAHAQYEVQVYARAILSLIRTAVPVATAAFEANR